MLDTWVEEGRVTFVGDELTVTRETRRFRLESAVRFVAEVASGDDPHGLVGKVKTLAHIEALAGEHDTGSVILGEHAYDVIDGFLGEATADTRSTSRAKRGQGGPANRTPGDALSELLRRT